MAKKKATEDFCFSCEKLLLTEQEKHGPFCQGCYQKTKRRDPLMQAAIKQALVAVVPTLCPHDGDRRHGDCKYAKDTAGRFNVIVLDKKLEPIEIRGPYREREAMRRAKAIRKRIGRRKS
jgi:hypothetical protein